MSGDSGDDPVPMVRKAIGRRDSHSYISVTFQTDLSNEFKKESYPSLPREPLGRSLPKEISREAEGRDPSTGNSMYVGASSMSNSHS